METITDNNALKEVDEEEEDDAFQATSGSVGGDTLTVPGLPQPPKKTNKAKPTGKFIKTLLKFHCFRHIRRGRRRRR